MADKLHLNQAIISHFLELKADAQPDKEILVFENSGSTPSTTPDPADEIFTYEMLYQGSNKIAQAFLDAGLTSGDTYAVFMRNHAEFVLSMLAGPVMGAIMVPIDPRSQGQRLKFLLTNSSAKAVVVSLDYLPALEAVLPDLPQIKTVFLVEKPGQTYEKQINHPYLNEILEQNTWDRVDQQTMDVRHPFQIIYTSGTTGDPKGVMIRNNRFGMFNIVTRLVWKYKPSDVLYTGLSLTHGNADGRNPVPGHRHRGQGGDLP
ncbi:MAG: acyl--CoA ligase [Desulfobacter sp.]|nr:MAG: acyl--CoA ligase [Desulfobacter sp.]